MTANIWEGSSIIGSTANADNSYKEQTYTVVTEGQTVFNLTLFAYQIGTGSLSVTVNGVDQTIAVDFTETSNTAITFTSGLKVDDFVKIKGLIGGTAAQAAAVSAAQAAAGAAAVVALNPPNLPLPVNQGGTGTTTKAQAFKNLAPTLTAGQVIGSTDGINYAGITIDVAGGAAEVTSAVDITLIATSSRVQSINMTVAGKSVYLPNATTLNKGGELFSFVAIGNSFRVRDADGNLLGTVSARTTQVYYLANNAAAAGTWAVGQFSASSNDPNLGTAVIANAVAVNSQFQVIELSAGVYLMGYHNGTNPQLQVVTVDTNLAPLMGTVLNTGLAYSTFRINKIDATTVALTATNTADNFLKAHVLTISGVGAAATVAAGAVCAVNAEAASFPQAVCFDTNKVLAIYRNATPNIVTYVLTRTGTTFAASASYTAAAFTPAGISNIYQPIANGTGCVFIPFNDSGVKVGSLTISASNVMATANYTTIISNGNTWTSILLGLIGTTKLLVAGLDNSGKNAWAGNVTVDTAGAMSGVSGNYAATPSPTPGNVPNLIGSSLIQLASNKFVLSYFANNTGTSIPVWQHAIDSTAVTPTISGRVIGSLSGNAGGGLSTARLTNYRALLFYTNNSSFLSIAIADTVVSV